MDTSAPLYQCSPIIYFEFFFLEEFCYVAPGFCKYWAVIHFCTSCAGCFTGVINEGEKNTRRGVEL